LTDKNFHPVRHLLEKHRYTSFEDLKSGLIRLKGEVEKNDQAPVQFMRDNLDSFLQCYDHLSDILLTCVLGVEYAPPSPSLMA
jgi:exocyst complex component 2